MKMKKLISILTATALFMPTVMPLSIMAAAESEVYTCDFTQLVKDGADTAYGTATDIYKLDDYTSAYLTYEGTYVSAAGEVYLKSSTVTNGAGRYAKGSYIAFTAPYDGTVTIKGKDIGVCMNESGTESYKGYGASLTYEMSAGDTLYAGYRKATTYVSSLSFEAAPPPTATPDITAPPAFDEPDREVLYSENFEGYEAGTTGGWTSPAGTMKIKSDANSLIGKYQTVVSGKSGTCRSGYIEIGAVTDNFVFECDFKSTSDVNVSDLELLESKSSVYANHGRYSNAKYAFTMARPKGSDLYVINNAADDSGLTLEGYEAPIIKTPEIADNPWLHVKVVGNYDTHTAIVYIMSLDRETTYYHGKVDMSPDITSWKCIHLLSPSTNADTCIDNIKVSKALDEDLSEVFYTVKINDGITEFSQYVADGKSAVNIPDMSAYGEYFLGWRVNGTLLTSTQLAAYAVTGDMTVTAEVSSDYIENIASVEFNSFPADGMLVMGPDGDTYADNEISLTILGERGTSLVSNPDSRVTDYKIDWRFDGFRTMDGTPTGESGSSYCDSYATAEVSEVAQSSVNFKLKNTSANYYGMVTATVTYNGRSMTASKPLMLIADTSRDGTVILPMAGYVSDYNKYESGIVGYECLISSDNGSGSDSLLGGWAVAGSCGSRRVALAEDATGKFLRLSREGSSGSAMVFNKIGDVGGQTVFTQDIRFSDSGSIIYKNGKSAATTDLTAFNLGFNGSEFTFNGTKIADGAKNTWYHIEICADTTTQLCSAKIYDMSGNLLGETDFVPFADDVSSLVYYVVKTSALASTIDFNNVNISNCKTDGNSFVVTKSADSVNVPSEGSVAVEMSVSAKTEEGYIATGAAQWRIDDEFAEGITIAADAQDSHKAVLTVEANASSGEIPVKITIGIASYVTTVKVIGTNDSIAFTEAATGAAIPSDDESTYRYSAEVRSGNGDVISGRAITYSLLNAQGGVSISADGILTVTAMASPQTILVKASSTDAVGNEISKTVKVSVYGNKFVFGAAKDGYTQVSAVDEYSDNRGYGVTGTAADNDGYMSGGGFKVKVEAGNVYSVKATYEGTIRCEYINSDFTGFERTKDSLGEDTFNVAVFGDGVLDITLSGEGKIASLEFEKVERSANSKPAWFTIGDSTIQQNGSWAYTIASGSTSDFSKYPALSGVISTFYNSGRAGRQHRSYYSEGLLNGVLTSIKPGDVVSISGMGTNDSGSTKEVFKEYNNTYIDAIEDMGGYVILGSYTPSGNYGATEGKVYDADNILFKGMRNNAYDVAIREVYNERVAAGDERVIGFIDIGKISDNLMTNDVRIEYNRLASEGKSIIEARAAAKNKAEEMMGWWKDYNHYYTTFSDYILPQITSRASQLISGEKQDALPEVIALAEIDPAITPAPTATPEPTATPLPTATPTPTPAPLDGTGVEVVSSDEYIDISSLVMYNNTTYRMYFADGTYTSVTAENGKVHNTSGGEVIVVPEYRFEFTNTASSTDPYINGYVKVGANSYSASKGYGLSGAGSINENGCRPDSGTVIKADVPKGYYDITVYRKGGARADVYAEGVQIIQNTTSASSQNRDTSSALMGAPGMMIESGSVDLTIGNTSGSNERIASVSIVRVPDKFRKNVIWIAGDSESANYYAISDSDLNSEKLMITGFGTQLDKYLSDKYAIANFGQPSATAGTWNNESLAAVKQRMVAGDTILICFGINDAISSSNKVDIETAKANIKNIVDAAQSKGVKPILLSPVYNSKYQGKSYFTYSNNTNVLGEFAKEIGVDFIDLNRFSMKYVNDAIAETQDSNWLLNNYHVADNLHLTQYSAMLIASIIAAGMEDIGYEVSDYAYTYKDIASVGEGNVRGEETGVTRVYSVDEAHKLMEAALATPKPESNVLSPYTAPSITWTFNAAQPATSGNNVPVVSGSASWSEANGAVKFDASTKDTGKLTITLEPEIKNNTTVEFDTYMTALGQQFFAYTITDTEGNKLVDCYFDKYNNSGELSVAGAVIASGSAFTDAFTSVRGDGMSGTPTHVKNEIDFASGTVTIKLGTAVLTGKLTGAETGDIKSVEIQSYRSKTADRHIYIDNLTISEEEKTDVTPQPTPEIEVNNINVLKTYVDEDNIGVTIADSFMGTAMAALYGADGRLMAVKAVADNTKASTIMFDKPSEMTGYIRLFGWEMSNIKPYDEAVTVKLSDISVPASDSVESFAYASYTEGDVTMPYRYYLPVNYNANEKYPVLVYLHAQTRTGTDNEGQLYNAQYMFNELLSEVNITKYPAILVAPQCDDSSTWADKAAAVKGMVNEIAEKFNADTDRIYLAGYSMGGDGCYEIAKANPGMFAAIMPIGGECDSVTAQQIAAENTAVMVFHGSADETVSADKAKAIVSAMIAGGASDAEYCEFYGESHNVQELSAKAQGVYEWLFNRSLKMNGENREKVVDLAIFMGQSNMAGRGEYKDATVCPAGHGYEFRSVTAPDVLCNITGPFGKNENNSAVNDNSGQGIDRRAGDMVSSIMESYYQSTGVPIVGVQCSRGGTNTGYWNGSTVKAEAQARLKAAKTYLEDNGYTIDRIFMVWCQGESDGDKLYSGSQSISGYKNGTLSVFNYMKEVGVEDMFIVQTGHYNADDPDGTYDAAYIAIHDAQAEMAQENEDIYVVGSFLEYQSEMKDAYHYHQSAYNAVGTAAGENIAKIYMN